MTMTADKLKKLLESLPPPPERNTLGFDFKPLQFIRPKRDEPDRIQFRTSMFGMSLLTPSAFSHIAALDVVERPVRYYIGPAEVFFSEHCTAPHAKYGRNFPESRHRSARIKKKLIRRFGSEFKTGPTVYVTQTSIHAHTSYKEELSKCMRVER